MRKVSIGSWAYVFGSFEKNPILLPELCEKLIELRFDGIIMDGFKPNEHSSIYATNKRKQNSKSLLKAITLKLPIMLHTFTALVL